MLEKILELFGRGVVALESIAVSLKHISNSEIVGAIKDLAETADEFEAFTDDGLMEEEPEAADAAPDTPTDQQPDTSGAGSQYEFNPYTEEVQGSYRTADKKGAIDAALAELGVDVKPSWNYVTRHKKVLEAAAANPTQPSGEEQGETQNPLGADSPAPEQQEESAAGATSDAGSTMTWDEFAKKLMADVEDIGADKAKDIVEQVTGQRDVNDQVVLPEHFQRILDKTGLREADPAPAGGDLLGGGTSEPSVSDVVKTMDNLTALAREKVQSGVAPADIQAAIKHIAEGVTQVPADKIDEAYGCLEIL